MGTSAPVKIDLRDHENLRILNEAVRDTAVLQSAALLDVETGSTLAVDETSEVWATLGHSLFSRSAEYSSPAHPGLSQPIHHMVLQFPTDALAAIRRENEPDIVASVFPASLGMEKSLDDLKHLSRAITQGTELPETSYLRIGSNHVTRIGKFSEKGVGAAIVTEEEAAANFMRKLFDAADIPPLASLPKTQPLEANALKEAYVYNELQCVLYFRPRFLPSNVLLFVTHFDIPVSDFRTLSRDCGNMLLLRVIDQVLAEGINADTALVQDDREWQATLEQLRSLEPDDLVAHLEVGGFSNQGLEAPKGFPDGPNLFRCQECIYYLPSQKWCDLPELPVPVEPHWYCRLWKL